MSPVMKSSAIPACQPLLHQGHTAQITLRAACSPPHLAKPHHHSFLELLLTPRQKNSLYCFSLGSVAAPPTGYCDQLCTFPPLSDELMMAKAISSLHLWYLIEAKSIAQAAMAQHHGWKASTEMYALVVLVVIGLVSPEASLLSL